MKINWFPGHMHKATKALIELSQKTDIVFEIVDARAPFSSSNINLSSIFTHKPIIKILTKKDLADANKTNIWLKYFPSSICINTLSEKGLQNKIRKLAQNQLPHRGTILKPIRAVIIGIPNVGKSTFINKLVEKKITKTGDTPAVTKNIQTIKIDKNFIVYDSPGIMLKNTQDEETGMKLSAISCIKDTAFKYHDVATFILQYLSEHYPQALKNRYGITEINSHVVNTIFIKILGLKKVAELSDFEIIKASQRVVQDFRKGQLGRITLEKPGDYTQPLE